MVPLFSHRHLVNSRDPTDRVRTSSGTLCVMRSPSLVQLSRRHADSSPCRSGTQQCMHPFCLIFYLVRNLALYWSKQVTYKFWCSHSTSEGDLRIQMQAYRVVLLIWSSYVRRTKLFFFFTFTSIAFPFGPAMFCEPSSCHWDPNGIMVHDATQQLSYASDNKVVHESLR